MEKKTTFEMPPKWLMAVAAVILLSAVGLRVHDHIVKAEPVTVLVVVGSASFTTEIADTNEKRELGLGQRDSLGARQAMYFPFPAAEQWVFWMKDMRFPIDIIWMRDGVVVDVTKNAPVPHDDIIDRFSPREPANGVLEVNAGVAEEVGIKLGDKVLFKT